MGYKLLTKSGINFYHASSAFQKFIRRGMEHEALWYATELYISGYEDYCWYRIKVMTSEDVGIANSTLPAVIDSLYSNYLYLVKERKKPSSARLPFIHAVMLLARSSKSRLVDNKLCYYFELRDHVPAPPLPDFVFDMHTIEGKIKKRGNAHFFAEAAAIVDAPIDDEFTFRDEVARLYEIEDSKPKPPKPPKPAKVSKTQEKLFQDVDTALEQRNLFDSAPTPDYDDSPY